LWVMCGLPLIPIAIGAKNRANILAVFEKLREIASAARGDGQASV